MLKSETKSFLSAALIAIVLMIYEFMNVPLFLKIWNIGILTEQCRLFSLLFLVVWVIFEFLIYLNKIELGWMWSLSFWLALFLSQVCAYICTCYMFQIFRYESYSVFDFPNILYAKIKLPYMYFLALTFLSMFISTLFSTIFISLFFKERRIKTEKLSLASFFKQILYILENFSEVFVLTFSIPILLYFTPSLRQILHIASIEYLLTFLELASLSLMPLPIYGFLFMKFKKKRHSTRVLLAIGIPAFIEFISYLYLFGFSSFRGLPVFFASILSLFGIAIGFSFISTHE